MMNPEAFKPQQRLPSPRPSLVPLPPLPELHAPTNLIPEEPALNDYSPSPLCPTPPPYSTPQCLLTKWTMRYTQPSMERLFALAHPRRFRTVFRAYYIMGITLNAVGAVSDYNDVEPRSWPAVYPQYLSIRFLVFMLLAIGLGSTYNLEARHSQFAHFFTLICAISSMLTIPAMWDMIYLSLEYRRQLGQPTEDTDLVFITESIASACQVTVSFWLPVFIIVWYTSFPVIFTWALIFAVFQNTTYAPGWYVAIKIGECEDFWQPVLNANVVALFMAHGVGIFSILSKDVVERKMFALQHQMIVESVGGVADEKGSNTAFGTKSTRNRSVPASIASDVPEFEFSVQNLFGLRKINPNSSMSTCPSSRQIQEDLTPTEDPSLCTSQFIETFVPTTKLEPKPFVSAKKIFPSSATVTQLSNKPLTNRERLRVVCRRAIHLLDPHYKENIPDFNYLEKEFCQYSKVRCLQPYRSMISVIAVTDFLHNFVCGTTCFSYIRLVGIFGTCALGLLLSVRWPRRTCINSVVYGIIIATYVFELANLDPDTARMLAPLLAIATTAAGSCGLRQKYAMAAFALGGAVGMISSICFRELARIDGDALSSALGIPLLEIFALWLTASVYGLSICRNREMSLRDYFARMREYTNNGRKRKIQSAGTTKLANRNHRSVSTSVIGTADYISRSPSSTPGTPLFTAGSEYLGQPHVPRLLKSLTPQHSIQRITRAPPDLTFGDHRDRRSPVGLSETVIATLPGARNDAFHSDSDDMFASSSASVTLRPKSRISGPNQKFASAMLSPEAKRSEHLYFLPGRVGSVESFESMGRARSQSNKSSPNQTPKGSWIVSSKTVAATERKAISLAKLPKILRSEDKTFRQNETG